MIDRVTFPDIAKLETLFERLPPNAREKTEKAALSAISGICETQRHSVSLSELRDIGNWSMLESLLRLCDDSALHATFVEAFGVKAIKIRPMPFHRISERQISGVAAQPGGETDEAIAVACPVRTRFRPGSAVGSSGLVP